MSNGKQLKSIWSRDFTLMTFGNFISTSGNTIASFALGLLVLDYTKSTSLYAIYMAAYTLPMIIMPMIMGPYLDRFSRKKCMYILDFISALIFVVFALMYWNNSFSFPLVIIGAALLGVTESIYKVAYESFFPSLIEKGNYQKAYSVSSTLNNLTDLMIPVSAVLYNAIGIVPIFIINAATFLLMALIELCINVQEKHFELGETNSTRKSYFESLKDGMLYLKNEKGLLAIAIYCLFVSLSGGAAQVIELPFFKGNYDNGEYVYMYVWAFALLGRMLADSIQYRFNIPAKRKYGLTFIVYITICVLGGIYLYLPLHVMMAMCFINGLGSELANNIRISSTQNYVSEQKKGRFNGIFHFLATCGRFLGMLFSGALVNILPERITLCIFMAITLLAVLIIMGSQKSKIAVIYNKKV